MLVALGACVAQSIHGPTTGPGTTPVRPALKPKTAARASRGSVRTLCRGAGISSNWAITDYVASSDCGSGGQTYNAMVVEDLSPYPLGSVLLICADQRRPADWDFTGADVGATKQCPREPTNKSTAATVAEVVRRRQPD
jgi:hypothetical protein